MTATDADGPVELDLVDPTTTTFLGFVTDNAFVSVMVLAAQQGNDTPAWPTVNNLTLGAAPTTGTSVPEPATLLLLATGLRPRGACEASDAGTKGEGRAPSARTE